MALVNDSRLQPLHPLLPLPAEPQQALVERTTSDTHFSRVEKTHRSVTEGRRARRARLPQKGVLHGLSKSYSSLWMGLPGGWDPRNRRWYPLPAVLRRTG